ncbi:aspartate carbamoyltransferase catalytic subunit [SCandidatus Aminicenantes bacterium Aminicenantia_JdfR_composite]|jgi:aspartate carbamoyltransferase catalytic subunit|nr:aspartate carbamoyltransferase catalytic subunit [SCandidatus Aminicenantes bacterium Aminicenantia_JdfR_composite]MCP2597427.1 aspartate carbamoyltransferase catalytic subunit [Candidatus Aminicenantes bacterium AC-335-G13]MCP2620747.1 aspartate carbamoyltransferase catalytic subunit [Candidatus Aminicenantes bacterium AC-334-E05]
MAFNHKHLLGIKDLNKEDILTILDTAESFREISIREIKKVPTLRGKTIINLFYEPSTRTRSSFEIAAKRLSADIINFNSSVSSVAKGETLKDTVLNLEAMRPDAIIIRHPASGAPYFLTTFCKSSVINAGDGTHEHPTQALLDALTIRQMKGDFSKLKVVIAGDILHSRVAKSNIFLLTKMGAKVVLSGPPPLVPPEFKEFGVEIDYNFDNALKDADVVMMLRIQRERQGKNFFPSLREYRNLYSLTPEKMKNAKKDAIIMHPGPINRGIELSTDLADSSKSVILKQVENGIAVRMAILYLLLGGGGK